mgnify:CR=1 FL=1
MSEEKNSRSSKRSWRNISQEVASRAMSKRGRRRQQLAVFRLVALAVLAGSLAWGGYAIVRTWETNRGFLAETVPTEPVRDVTLLTNGVLPGSWVTQTLALPKDATLMSLDLAALRDRLMAHGQVSYAALTRSFPDTLIVTLQERTPVARIQVNDRGVTKQLMVSKDGVVYEGINYDKTLVASLPWLDGFTLRRADSGGYEPIAGMVEVADLLTTAQIQAPHLYRDWLIVSLARLNDYRELIVKAQDIDRIVFSAKDDYVMQLARLDHIIDQTQAEMAEPMLQSVNLALGSQVPVTLAKSPEEIARQQQQRALQRSFNFQIQPSPQRKRDL